MEINVKKLKIRKLELSDIPVLVKYRIDYLAELQNKNVTEFSVEIVSGLKAYFKKSIAQGSFTGFMAENENGQPIAFGGMIIKEIPGDFYKALYREAEILNMYTVPEARKQGISTILLEKLIEEAKNTGISKLALHTTTAGENIYRNAGFSEPAYPYLEFITSINNFTH